MDIMRQSACFVVTQLWFRLKLYDDGTGLRLNDGLDEKV